MRETEEPVKGKSNFDGETFTHPAFGQISVSRVSGDVHLYGSDFKHHGYVIVRVYRSKLDRSLSRDSHFADIRPVIEVAMSESQWATFVSSFNMGHGVPCTIQQIEGKAIPGIPFRDSKDEYKREAQETLEDSIKELLKTRDLILANTSGLSKKKQDEMVAGINSAIQQLQSNFPFVMDSMAKFMEKRVEKAKVEVNAYVNGAIQRAGLDALERQGAVVPPLSIEHK
ncbi:MAG: hypothetical protein EOP83_23830 [Verrucomicrobiaceae bacterium]|nr:MAG: hypothetical protein EOP83_23830 [Verrucomicrobiaceae bacterium]